MRDNFIQNLVSHSFWRTANTHKTSLMCAMLALFLTAAQTPGRAETFTIHHFLSAKAITHTKLLVPWAERITKQSGGRLKFEIFPAMTMGGKPADLYRQVRDGTADLVWTLSGYTPGVFPRLEVFELANVHRGSAHATTMAIQDVMALLAPDLKKIHPILVHVHAGNALHLVRADVKSMADLTNLKIRSPSRTGAWMIQSWKGEPVGMPVPALPQALSKAHIDGALIPYEVAIPLRIAEFARTSVELAGGDRFGTSVFLFAMNKRRYQALPADLRKIIDDNSGRALAPAIAAAWDAMEPIGMDVARKRGRTVRQLSKEATAQFHKAHETVVERWIKQAAKRGIDGKALVAAARKAIETHTAGK